MCFLFCVSTIWKWISTNRANRQYLQMLGLSLAHASCWTLANRRLIRLRMWPSLQCKERRVIWSGDALPTEWEGMEHIRGCSIQPEMSADWSLQHRRGTVVWRSHAKLMCYTWSKYTGTYSERTLSGKGLYPQFIRKTSMYLKNLFAVCWKLHFSETLLD